MKIKLSDISGRGAGIRMPTQTAIVTGIEAQKALEEEQLEAAIWEVTVKELRFLKAFPELVDWSKVGKKHFIDNKET